MRAYLDIVRKILSDGERLENRTGVDALTIPGMMFEHDMSAGFPLLTTKRMPFGLVATELEFFIKGKTDKRWLQERGNSIWNDWCNPTIVPYGHDDETKARMRAENDLGPIYGKQWRCFGGDYPNVDGYDQLAEVLETLRRDPRSRRMVVSAWNPWDLPRMALPPCHYAFQVTTGAGRLNLLWTQRSVDVALGLPFNIASYGLLLTLFARQANLAPGMLVGFLADTHIYYNHVDTMMEQLHYREPYDLPEVRTPLFTNLLDWRATDTAVVGYQSHGRLHFPMNV